MPEIATPDGVSAHDVLVSRDQVTSSYAELVFGDGVAKATLRAGSDIDGLLAAHFEGSPPKVRADNGRIQVDSSHLSLRSKKAEYVLSPSIPWSIVVNGGASDFTADLDGIDLTALDIHGGVSKVELTLGTPSAEGRLNLGSVSNLEIRRPADVGVRIEASGGLTKLTLDDEYFGSVGGGLATETSGYKTATSRYLLSVNSGTNITITTK
jgi:hypothetical protein